MSFFTVSTDANVLKDSGGKMFFPKSDIYKVTIDTIRVVLNESNARHLHFKLTDGSRTQYLLNDGLKLDQNNGKEHFQAHLFNKLCIIAGFEEINEPVTESRMWFDKPSKGDLLQDIDVLDQFDNLEVYVKIAVRYSIYDGKISQGYEIENFYRASDMATANEIVNGLEVGVQYKKDLPLCADIYRDNLTIEDVEEWKASGYGKDKEKEPEVKSKPKNNPFDKK